MGLARRAVVLVLFIAVSLLVAPEAVRAKKAGARVVRLTLGPFPIEARSDREVCRVVRVPGLGGLAIESWEARSRTYRRGLVGTHHFVAYGYDGTDVAAFPAPDALVDDPGCAGLGPRDFFKSRTFLAGSGGETQEGKWLVTSAGMPGGLTQVIPAAGSSGEGIVVLNSHYFNSSTRRAHGLVRLKLRVAPVDPRKRVVRQMTDAGASRAIKIAPGAVGPAVSATWAADGAPNDATEGGRNPDGDVCVFALTPHMHKRGTLFTIAYEQDGSDPKELHTTTDYLHPGSKLLPLLGTSTPGLLRAYSEANGHPRIRYACTHANGAAGVEPKLGCEESAGQVPGRSAAEAWPDDAQRLGNDEHARPCGLDGGACRGFGTGRCVPANLVFGPLSDDEMCILVALVYEPRRDVAPEDACNPNL
jgi:hypothetical protein